MERRSGDSGNVVEELAYSSGSPAMIERSLDESIGERRDQRDVVSRGLLCGLDNLPRFPGREANPRRGTANYATRFERVPARVRNRHIPPDLLRSPKNSRGAELSFETSICSIGHVRVVQ
jgi:hypothetical protein